MEKDSGQNNNATDEQLQEKMNPNDCNKLSGSIAGQPVFNAINRTSVYIRTISEL